MVPEESHQRVELEVCQPLVFVRVWLAKCDLFWCLPLHPALAERFKKLDKLTAHCQFFWHLDLNHVFHQHGNNSLPVRHLHQWRHDMYLLHACFLKLLRSLQIVCGQLDTAPTDIAEPDRWLRLHDTKTGNVGGCTRTTDAILLCAAQPTVAKTLQRFLVTREAIFLLIVLRLNRHDLRSW